MKIAPLILLMLLVPASASAATATYHGGTLTYTAAPGEQNHVTAEVTSDCAELAAPCVRLFDVTGPATTSAPCVDAGFDGTLCPLPAVIAWSLGDGLDYINDWDGPSVIHGGPGGDVLRGRGGNDAIYGDDGWDDVVGGPGDDRLDGGAGSDHLESFLGGFDGDPSPADSAGSDVLIGGAGADIASYEERTDPLVLSLNGRADDGADGEDDDLGDDIEEVRAGHGDDAIVGSPRAEVLRGGEGEDIITGAAGQDYVDGGDGPDTVIGGDGNDDVAGGGGADLVVGGPGSDMLFGEYKFGCAASIIGCSDGDDEIQADDGEIDGVDCGGGDDRAAVDRGDVFSTLASCELVAAAPRPTVRRVVAHAKKTCRRAHGAKRRRCVERAVATCRKRFHGKQRSRCVRSVRRVLR